MSGRILTGVGFHHAKGRRHTTIFLTLIALLASWALTAISSVGQGGNPAVLESAGVPDLGTLPLHFEPNVGQADPQARFITRAPGGTFFFTPSEVALSLQAGAAKESITGTQALQPNSGNSGVVHMKFVGANPDVQMQSGPLLSGKINYMRGNDPAKWHSNVPTHSEIAYIGLYSGINLSYGGDAGQLKGTYTLAAGVSPEVIGWHYTGASGARVDEAGNLLVTLSPTGEDTSASVLAEQAPVAWQEIGDKHVPVPVAYLLREDGTIGFSTGEYDHSHPLIIDPTLTLPYSTYLGGDGVSPDDFGQAIAVDGAGNAYVTGYTLSGNFPVRNQYQGDQIGMDAFVTKLNTNLSGNASLVYSTYLGGDGSDAGNAIAVDEAGNAYISGYTSSTNFPTQNSYQGNQATDDIFVARLSASGSVLVYSTYLGGGHIEYGEGIAVDGAGNVYVTGNTSSTNFPTLNGYQADQPGPDVFVTKLNTTLSGNASLVYSTYLGGDNEDFGEEIAIDGAGTAYITGSTTSTNFPLHDEYQGDQLSRDAFVTRLNPSGSGILYSTYLGASDDDIGYSLAVDGAGNAFVTGSTRSADFPARNQYQAYVAQFDVFVTKLNTTLAGDPSLVYSTFLGGSANDIGNSIAVNGGGSAYVSGFTDSIDFPVHNEFQANQPSQDAFVTRLTAAGSGILYSTYLGGSSNDLSYGIAIDGAGNAYITGFTKSSTFPVNNQYQNNQVGDDAFVSKLSEPVLPCAIQFTDVPQNNTFYPNIRCLACRGILGGHGDGTFRPNNEITRGQIAKMVSNAASYTDNVNGRQTYADVPSTQTFWQWIERLSVHGVMGGYACGGVGEPCDGQNRPYFRPNNNATRGQLSKIVSNAAAYVDPPIGQMFEDVPPNNTFYTEIGRLSSRGIMGGYACGAVGEPCGTENRPYFRPSLNVTRGQASKIVANTFFPNCQTP